MGGKFYLKTLGCKVNQVESACLAERLSVSGMVQASEAEAEILILNSCAVTEKAVSEAKKIVKGWLKKKPRLIVVCGCATEIRKEDFVELSERASYQNLVILGQKEKLNPSHILQFGTPPLRGTLGSQKEELPLLNKFSHRSRAFLKVQDGCSSHCSYCIVPLARGPSRSYPLEHILKQAQIFIDQGYREIVITGIHVGMWGKDLVPPRGLRHLLENLEELIDRSGKKILLRLSSVEVLEFDEDMFRYLLSSKYLCPHFHVPLQSGSNRILKLMNRHYTKEKYQEILQKLKELFPSATFGADVIVGFPTESEEDFQETVEVVEKSPLNWLHIFPYSPRPGTPAEKLSGRVPQGTAKFRADTLRKLIEKKRSAFIEGLTGKVFLAILERVTHILTALTENFVQVNLTETCPKGIRASLKPGDMIEVKLLGTGKNKRVPATLVRCL